MIDGGIVEHWSGGAKCLDWEYAMKDECIVEGEGLVHSILNGIDLEKSA